jgi:short-subunit dehydrogenase
MPTGQTALITGASRGIGLELARLFAADGHNLVLVARSADDLEKLAEELSQAHDIETRVVVADLSDPASPAQIAAELNGVNIDFLVNNAGFGTTGAFHTLPVQREVDQVQVNVSALTALTGHFLPGMVARGQGQILNIASTAAFQPGPYMATYYATKAYVLSFSESLAHELKGSGVTVTAHCPGATATGFGATAGNDVSKLFTLQTPATAASVAIHAYRSSQAGKTVAIPGLKNWLGAFSVRLGPRWLVRYFAALLNRP